MDESKSPVTTADADDEHTEDDEDGALVVHETPTKGKGKRPHGGLRKTGGPISSSTNEQTQGVSLDNLTLTNVRSIIYNVVKDADVQKMLSNTLQEDNSKLVAATYEPKMTRAKMKQVLEREGNVPYPWPLSPIKSSAQKNQQHNFTDLHFPEEDNDEDYNYDKDLEEILEMYSDEDDESYLSAYSDVGSPMYPAAKSPQVSNSPSLTLPVISAKHDNLPQVCMGPPPAPSSASQQAQQNFFEALDQLDLSDAIARRTRSQLPLKDTSLCSIQAEFIPPDTTRDMYEDPEQDEDLEWKDFLQNLLKDDVPVEDDDDPEADPEYNVLAEPDTEAEDDHILPVRVTKNEINRLMDELYENEWPTNDEEENSQDVPPYFNTPQPLPINKIPSVAELLEIRQMAESCQPPPQVKEKEQSPEPVPQLPAMNMYERKQLSNQMQAYVQILCQHAVVGQVSAPHLAQQSGKFLKELSVFASTSQVGAISAFNAANLYQAVELVSDYKQDGEVNADPQMLTLQQRTTLASSPVFLYPRLLPPVPFKSGPSVGRVRFHHAEDVLICMGLEEFKECKGPGVDKIQEYMLPMHSAKSIRMHILNECKKMRCDKTTIGRFRGKGLIPGVIHLTRDTSTDFMVAPIDRQYQPRYPNWLKTFNKQTLYVISNMAAAEINAALPSLSETVTSPVTAGPEGDTVEQAPSISTTNVESDKCNQSIAGYTNEKLLSAGPQNGGEVSSNPTLHTDADVPPDCMSNTDFTDAQISNTDVLLNPTTTAGGRDTSATSTVPPSYKLDTDVPVTIASNTDLTTTQTMNSHNSSSQVHNTTSFDTSHNEVSSIEVLSAINRPQSTCAERLARDHNTSRVAEKETGNAPNILNILSGLSEAYAQDKQEVENSCDTSKSVTTPTKVSLDQSPSKRWRSIVCSQLKTPEKQYTSIDPNWKMRNCSPRRKELRTKAQAIVPKSFVPTVYIPSPTKKAAKAISDKALSRAAQISKYKSPLKRSASYNTVQTASALPTDKQPSVTTTKRAKAKPKTPTQVDDGMFSALIESNKSRTTKKHSHSASLAKDIIEKDPQRMEREEMFSRWYMNKVKEILDATEYNTFLEALIAFGKQKKNPAVFYGELRNSVFKDQPELLQGFAAFLLPAQALACGEKCYRDCIQFNQARRFLRRIEVYFGARSKQSLKLMKLLRACDVTQPKDELRTVISDLLKRHTTLLEEFNMFFPDAPPPKRHEEDYEEMDLTTVEEEAHVDGFEQMDVPEVEMTNATLQCKCPCHEDEQRRKYYHLRKKHCDDCRITVVHSTLCIHAGPSQGLRPAYVRYLNNTATDAVANSDEDSKYSDVECESPVHNVVSSDTEKPSSPTVVVSFDEKEGQSTVSPPVDEDAIPNCWTRSEDRFILEAMQQADSLSLGDDALFSLSTNLKHRSTQEIKERFDTLLQLLSQELGSEDSDSNR